MERATKDERCEVWENNPWQETWSLNDIGIYQTWRVWSKILLSCIMGNTGSSIFGAWLFDTSGTSFASLLNSFEFLEVQHYIIPLRVHKSYIGAAHQSLYCNEWYGAFHNQWMWFLSVFPYLSDDSVNNCFMMNNETHLIAKQNFTATKIRAGSQLSLSLLLSLSVSFSLSSTVLAHTVCGGMFLCQRLHAKAKWLTICFVNEI